MAIKIYPYKQGSRSARALADALGGRVLRLQGSTYRYRDRDTIINWGNSNENTFPRTLNDSLDILGASNKLTAFMVMRDAGVQIPQFWIRREDIPDDAFPIVCRTILNSHSGRGIVIANNVGELVNAPLYVKYMKKRDEFRIHVGKFSEDLGNYPYAEGGDVPRYQVICQQRKAIPNGTEPIDTRVRNHHNGYVFVRNNVEPPAQVLEQATRAITALGLDFGAVDIIWNNHYQLATVLEVNTAPGLCGTTITDYANYFRNLIEG